MLAWRPLGRPPAAWLTCFIALHHSCSLHGRCAACAKEVPARMKATIFVVTVL